jgi:hypothetical protein
MVVTDASVGPGELRKPRTLTEDLPCGPTSWLKPQTGFAPRLETPLGSFLQLPVNVACFGPSPASRFSWTVPLTI